MQETPRARPSGFQQDFIVIQMRAQRYAMMDRTHSRISESSHLQLQLSMQLANQPFPRPITLQAGLIGNQGPPQ